MSGFKQLVYSVRDRLSGVYSAITAGENMDGLVDSLVDVNGRAKDSAGSG